MNDNARLLPEVRAQPEQIICNGREIIPPVFVVGMRESKGLNGESGVVQSKFHKFAKAIVISTCAAVVTPALGAGIVAGTATAVQVVADASIPPRLQTEDSSITEDARDDGGISTGPRRLSPLAGTDERAWNNAKSVHVHLFAKKAH